MAWAAARLGRTTGLVRPVGTAARYASSFLSDPIIKAALRPEGAARDFVSAFAPLLHAEAAVVTRVQHVETSTATSILNDVKHDVALKYEYKGTRATVDVMSGREMAGEPQGRALVEAQRSIAHVGAHFIRAVHERADILEAAFKPGNKASAQSASSSTASDTASAQSASSSSTASDTASVQPTSSGTVSDAASAQPTSGGSLRRFDKLYAAYAEAEPVHLVMLCEYAFAHNPKALVNNERKPKWVSAKTLWGQGVPVYSCVAPLFKTYRMGVVEGTPNIPLSLLRDGTDNSASSNDAGMSTEFDDTLRRLVSITLVHLPLVPEDVDDLDAWKRVVTGPSQADIVVNNERLRKWLHLLAHTKVIADKQLQPPGDLKGDAVFEASVTSAQRVLGETLDAELAKDREWEDLVQEKEELLQEKDAELQETKAELERLKAELALRGK